jgi:hypothetical protein
VTDVEPRLTNKQLAYLRQLRAGGMAGLQDQAPRARIWAKWMRQPHFVRALRAAQHGAGIATRLLLAQTAARAAAAIGALLASDASPTPAEREVHRDTLRELTRVLQLEMTRRQASEVLPMASSGALSTS